MPRYRHALFDLDGTLIDSAPAILASYRDAFSAAGRTPTVAEYKEAVKGIDLTKFAPPVQVPLDSKSVHF